MNENLLGTFHILDFESLLPYFVDEIFSGNTGERLKETGKCNGELFFIGYKTHKPDAQRV